MKGDNLVIMAISIGIATKGRAGMRTAEPEKA
jgi:hypothetical protein